MFQTDGRTLDDAHFFRRDVEHSATHAATHAAHAATAHAAHAAAHRALILTATGPCTASTTGATHLCQDRDAGKHVGKLHIERLVGLVLDQQVPLRGVFEDRPAR